MTVSASNRFSGASPVPLHSLAIVVVLGIDFMAWRAGRYSGFVGFFGYCTYLPTPVEQGVRIPRRRHAMILSRRSAPIPPITGGSSPHLVCRFSYRPPRKYW